MYTNTLIWHNLGSSVQSAGVNDQNVLRLTNICAGGGNVATGYYKMPEKTKEDFFTDENGMRWFKTGDIGRFEEDGKLTIVDRKKDLVKLQLGEYISLGKVEAQLKTCPIVDNCCIYGDGMQNYVVALVVANKDRLEVMAEKLGVSGQSFEELCKNKDITGAVLKDLQNHGKRVGLQKFELPGAFQFAFHLVLASQDALECPLY